MNPPFLYDPEHWRTRAQTMRILARDVQDLAIREMRLASDADRLAAAVENPVNRK